MDEAPQGGLTPVTLAICARRAQPAFPTLKIISLLARIMK